MQKRYDLYGYLRPVWLGGKIENETIMFLGEDDEARLLYTPCGKVSVKNYFLDKTFSEGKDYSVDGDRIKRLAGGEIPFFTAEEYYTTERGKYGIEINADKAKEICLEGKRYLLYGEGDSFTKRQIAVSYVAEDRRGGYIPQDKSGKFAVFFDKIARKEEIAVTFYGDSIAAGCNASGTEFGGNTPPYMDPFPVLFTEFCERTLGAKINAVNVSVGGWSTEQGLNAYDERVAPTRPDLLVLAFGMNDMSTPLDKYAEMYEEMIGKTRAINPTAEILAIAPMWPNTDSAWVGNQIRFKEVLGEFEKKYPFFAMANVTDVHGYVLKRKRYRDMTANNINHPNDFLGRIYAQVMLKTVLGDRYERVYTEKDNRIGNGQA